jgi:hypothetical protein
MNTSTVALDKTARTRYAIAQQRATHLKQYEVNSVLELCVGPSLRSLETAYAQQDINCIGNDIDARWKAYYPQGQWRMGDCFSVSWSNVDAVIFAPPLSRGCSGERHDSLTIFEVFPKYTDFLTAWKDASVKVSCLVLPARSLATKSDRSDFHKLLHLTRSVAHVEFREMIDGCRKYVDVYLQKNTI